MIETATATNGHTKPTHPVTDVHREKSKTSRKQIRHTLREAIDLKDLAYQAALDLRQSSESTDQARERRAKAITSLIRAWCDTVEVIRIQRGKPLPGSLRPEQAKPRRQVKDRADFMPAPTTASVQPDSPDNQPSK